MGLVYYIKALIYVASDICEANATRCKLATGRITLLLELPSPSLQLLLLIILLILPVVCMLYVISAFAFGSSLAAVDANAHVDAVSLLFSPNPLLLYSYNLTCFSSFMAKNHLFWVRSSIFRNAT